MRLGSAEKITIVFGIRKRRSQRRRLRKNLLTAGAQRKGSVNAHVLNRVTRQGTERFVRKTISDKVRPIAIAEGGMFRALRESGLGDAAPQNPIT